MIGNKIETSKIFLAAIPVCVYEKIYFAFSITNRDGYFFL